MDYAIIKSGHTNLLEVIKLSKWNSWEWDNFSTVKSVEDNDIKWFDEEKEAIDFMLNNFPMSIIDSKYFKSYINDRKYYID